MDLYQELILEHYKRPVRAGLRDPFDAEVHHVNPTPRGLRLGCEMLGVDGSIERALQRCVDQMQKRQRWAEALI